MKSHSIPRQARDGEQSRTIIIGLIVIILVYSFAEARYNGGTGEPNDPYRIATPEDLNDIGNHQEDWDKHFILVNDVNLTQYTDTQFNRIGTDWENAFTGVFNGNDHKVWNFTWSSTDRNGIGLFGYVSSGGQIKNLGMENVDVNALNGEDVGGLVGGNWSSTITNCYSSGSVSGGDYVGGMVGTQWGGGTITNCYSTGSVSGDTVGGLSGFNWGMITNCYSTSTVSGGVYVGGLVGFNVASPITNGYSTGSVSGYEQVGGFVGMNLEGTITDCYSMGSVSGNRQVGGLLGHDWDGTTIASFLDVQTSGRTQSAGRKITDSFWDVETSGQSISAGGTPKTTAEMKTRSTFTDAGWDFIEIWGIGEHQTYPYLRFAPAGDLNYDKRLDFADFAIFADHWLVGITP